MIKDVLIVLSKHDFSYQAIEEGGYDIDCPYCGNTMPFRLLREIFFKYKLPGKSIWYNKRVNKGAKVIIVYNALITVEYMYWLRENNPYSRIIYLYTDPVDKAIQPEALPDEICEKWSSDFLDCEKYGLCRGLPGGYHTSWTVNKRQPEYDVLFVGRDKGRLKQLIDIKKIFEEMGLTTNFYITAHHRWQRFSNPIYRPLIPYSEVLDMVGKTRAILHLMEGGYKSISIRVMESIIHNVKLITDNKYLRHMEIYKASNFFILGEDDIKRLPDFLAEPYEPYDEKYIDSLSYDRMIAHIVNADCRR